MSKWKKDGDYNYSRAFGDVNVGVYRWHDASGVYGWHFDVDYQHNGNAPTKKAAKAKAKRMGKAIADAIDAIHYVGSKDMGIE
jgi:hypothetical protein